MKILFLFIQLIFVFGVYSDETKAINSKKKEKVSEHKTASRKGKTAQVKVEKSKRKIVEIKGQFMIKNKYKVNFILSERDGEHYLTLFVKGGSCDYHVRRLKAPQQIRGYKGIIFSNKVPGCNFGISNVEINNLFNSFELVDLVYSVNEKDKIEGDITLSSLTETYNSQIY